MQSNIPYCLRVKENAANACLIDLLKSCAAQKFYPNHLVHLISTGRQGILHKSNVFTTNVLYVHM